MYKPISYLLHTFLVLVLIGMSGSILYFVRSSPHAKPVIETPVPTPIYSGTFEAIPEDGWSTLRRGLEMRTVQIYDNQNQPVETVHVWRIDQDDFRLDVAFEATPKSLETWQKETDAELVMNGGYFSIDANEKRFADGLLVVDGQASGKTFSGFGGMLTVTDGRAELRWLVQKPYDYRERLDAALQAFPILVKPGGVLGFGPEREDGAHARRTVIAQDRQGRILLIVAPQGYFTLHQLSAYLTASDLDIDIALNLDGGGSTGILVDEPREVIQPKVLLPYVIVVYSR